MSTRTVSPARPSVAAHFVNRPPEVRAIYDRVLAEARKLGKVIEDPKKTSIHLLRKTAFAGVGTRRDALILTLKSTTDRKSARIVKHERPSANRWYLEVRLERVADVDRELVDWLAASWNLSH